MLRNNLKIGYRNLLRNKGYSFINIFGLALGIACCLLTLNYVQFEFSYDNFHPDADRTYRVDQRMPFRANDAITGSTAPPLAYTLKSNYPEVEAVLRINTPGDYIVRYEDKSGSIIAFQEENVFAADSTFFSFFGFPLKEGNPRTALRGMNKVVISEATAKKLFADLPALGKVLQFGENRTPVEVTGVTAKQPKNSHFHFDYLISMETNPNVLKRDWSWVWTQMATYIRLKKGADARELQTKLGDLGEKVIRPAFESSGMDYDNAGTRKLPWSFYLRPMSDLHLKTGTNRLGPVGNINYVYTFAMIGVFVLIIAAINFINLSTARGTKRAKEVGVKKTLGASKRSLITQFQSESIFLTMVATLLSLLLVEVLRLFITRFAGIDIEFTLWTNPGMLLLIPAIPLAIGSLAGIYPSFYLTAFRPIHVLKGKIAAGVANSGLRNVLVVLQFTISIALIAGTIVVFQQLKFMTSTNLGFDKENILLIRYAEKLGTHLEAFRHELRSYQGVQDVGLTMEVPGANTWTDGLSREGSDVKVPIAIVKIDEHYFTTLDFKLVAGRLFSESQPADKNAVVLNETAVRQLGWSAEQAIGKYIIYPGNENSRHEVVGVMKDSHYQSLQQAIVPVLFTNISSDIWGDWFTLTVKFKSAEIAELIRHIRQKWNAVLDDTPFAYSFLDQDLAKQYESDEKLGRLFGIFSALSILIAIIGLVGLVSYSAEARQKEIGIRKVFGASTGRILLLMNSHYLKLILISLFLAAPFAWWLIVQWLDSFAYRIELSPLTFVIAGLCQTLLAFAAVGYLSFKAATLNPAKVLKEE
jgi:putative ABC transport system permease protein